MALPVRPSMTPNVRWQFVLVYNAPPDWRARALEDVAAAVLDEAVRVGDAAGLPVHHYPLERTAEAHAAVEGATVGKVLVDVVRLSQQVSGRRQQPPRAPRVPLEPVDRDPAGRHVCDRVQPLVVPERDGQARVRPADRQGLGGQPGQRPRDRRVRDATGAADPVQDVGTVLLPVAGQRLDPDRSVSGIVGKAGIIGIAGAVGAAGAEQHQERHARRRTGHPPIIPPGAFPRRARRVSSRRPYAGPPCRRADQRPVATREGAAMKAWQVTGVGEPADVLRLGEVADVQPGPGQVAVRVLGCAANFPDVLMCRGLYQERPEIPYTPGIELCGEVVAVGADVADLAVGDRVLGGADLPAGGFAECALMSASDTFPAPPALDDAQAAALHVAYQTGWFGLHRRARLQAGETLLVHAAAGGVGSAAIQLGTAAGARVVGVVGEPGEGRGRGRARRGPRGRPQQRRLRGRSAGAHRRPGC